eukprot:2032881-Amphidinium_carterae.2
MKTHGAHRELSKEHADVDTPHCEHHAPVLRVRKAHVVGETTAPWHFVALACTHSDTSDTPPLPPKQLNTARNRRRWRNSEGLVFQTRFWIWLTMCLQVPGNVVARPTKQRKTDENDNCHRLYATN